MLRQKPTQVLPLRLLKEATINLPSIWWIAFFEYLCGNGINGAWLPTGAGRCRGQSALYFNESFGEFGVAWVFRCGYRWGPWVRDIFRSGGNVYGQVYSYNYCRLLTKIGIHRRISCGDNFTSKNFKKLSLVESFFNIRQDYSLQLRTLVGFPLITQKR